MCWIPTRTGGGEIVLEHYGSVWFFHVICVLPPKVQVTSICFHVCSFSFDAGYPVFLCLWEGEYCFPMISPNDPISCICTLIYFTWHVSVHAHVPFWYVFPCAFVCVSWKTCTLNTEEEEKKNNQFCSSLGSVTKVIPRFYQWAKVPVAMETLMNENGPCNRGDGVNEELPHQSDPVCDSRCCLETDFWIASSAAALFSPSEASSLPSVFLSPFLSLSLPVVLLLYLL